MSRLVGYITALIVLLSLSAFFSAAETAITSLSKLRLRVLVEEGEKRAKTLEKLVERPAKLLSTLLVANNAVNITATTIGTALFIAIFGPERGLWVATIVITLVLLLFGEITPKTLAAQSPEKVAMRVSRPTSFLVTALAPVVKVFTALSGLLLRLVGVEITAGHDPYITEQELRTIVNVGEQQGILEEEERAMIHSVFEFGDTEVHTVMRPRIDIFGIPRHCSISEILASVIKEGFSRIPVYEETIDDIVGIVYAKDLLRLCFEKKTDTSIRELLRPAYYVPESKKVNELFRELQKERVHMAVVLDEFGGTAGIVTIEDLMEEIFGEIEDEYDQEDAKFLPINADTTIIDARLTIEEVNAQLGLHLPENGDETVGGLIFSLFGRIPGEGEQIACGGANLIVERMDGRRVAKIRIQRSLSD
ncbi:MAG TPA: hemolysin [Firmicutes bacterium]|jgi:CBS domain containing-hemolysin-like protein|nr:hemolysin [Bacillota bacterium]HBL48747.1 hemolysin [Bacillota bacterium]HBL67359.1 hemolysin [Bacillota bacterium]HBR25291.1 hemolysin [Bacillota bacterium]